MLNLYFKITDVFFQWTYFFNGYNYYYFSELCCYFCQRCLLNTISIIMKINKYKMDKIK